MKNIPLQTLMKSMIWALKILSEERWIPVKEFIVTIVTIYLPD